MGRLANTLILFLAFVFTIVSGAEAEKRVALVIGNSAYKYTEDLANPKNDAAAISRVLRQLGFDVVEGLDLTKVKLEYAIRDFTRKLKGAKIGLFFYAGHGLQVYGKNYLVPVDSALKDEADLDFEAVKLDFVLRQMERYKHTNLVFLDACRNNPLARNLARTMGTRGQTVGRGLASVRAGVGTMITFATQPGNVAYDGAGKHSPFAKAFLEHIETPGIDIANFMRRVRRSVIKQTNGAQVPWNHSSLTASFYFKEKPKPAPIARMPTPSPTPKIVASKPIDSTNGSRQSRNLRQTAFEDFKEVRAIGTCGAYQHFKRTYPDTFYTKLADEWIKSNCNKPEPQKSASIAPENSEQPDNLNKQDLAMKLQTELKRVGCYTGRIDGDWGRRSRTALANYNEHSKVTLAIKSPEQRSIDEVRKSESRVCPKEMSKTEVNKKKVGSNYRKRNTKNTLPSDLSKPKKRDWRCGAVGYGSTDLGNDYCK